MAFGYPVLLELAGRRAVVIGEFAVEAGKVEGLLAAGAEVTVVAKGPEAALDRLEGDPRVVVHRRGYGGSDDLAGAVVCVASAAEPAVRDAIAADARAAGVLVNVMDDVPNCDFAAPAIVRRGDLLIAIGTGGRAPALARRLRAELADRFGPEWTELMDVVGRVRA
ncbi:MAG: bifunctional precorrin-2 dehydrogenase/sirohydrochlorin ferrochelatase, partial [Actinomycetes bacterium]